MLCYTSRQLLVSILYPDCIFGPRGYGGTGKGIRKLSGIVRGMNQLV